MAKKIREIIKLLEADGWYFKRMGKGSHMVYRHPVKAGIVVVPNHGLSRELKPGTEDEILKQAGLK